jgi:hypothetical protein
MAVLCFGAFAGMVVAFTIMDRQSYLPSPDAWDSIADALGVIIGIPTSLAGSIVAVVLAGRALALTKRQTYQEMVTFVEGEVRGLTEAFTELGESIAKGRGLQIALWNSFHQYYHKKEDQLVQLGRAEIQQISEIYREIDQVRHEIASNLRRLMKHPTAVQAWRLESKWLDDKDAGMMRSVFTRRPDLIPDLKYYNARIEKQNTFELIHEVSHLLEQQAVTGFQIDSESANYASHLNYRVETFIALTKTVNLDIAEDQCLLRMGAAYMHVPLIRGLLPIGFFNIGALFLKDVKESFPSAASIEEALKERVAAIYGMVGPDELRMIKRVSESVHLEPYAERAITNWRSPEKLFDVCVQVADFDALWRARPDEQKESGPA